MTDSRSNKGSSLSVSSVPSVLRTPSRNSSSPNSLSHSLAQAEQPAAPKKTQKERTFESLDADKNGVLTRDEFLAKRVGKVATDTFSESAWFCKQVWARADQRRPAVHCRTISQCPNASNRRCASGYPLEIVVQLSRLASRQLK